MATAEPWPIAPLPAASPTAVSAPTSAAPPAHVSIERITATVYRVQYSLYPAARHAVCYNRGRWVCSCCAFSFCGDCDHTAAVASHQPRCLTCGTNPQIPNHAQCTGCEAAYDPVHARQVALTAASARDDLFA